MAFRYANYLQQTKTFLKKDLFATMHTTCKPHSQHSMTWYKSCKVFTRLKKRKESRIYWKICNTYWNPYRNLAISVERTDIALLPVKLVDSKEPAVFMLHFARTLFIFLLSSNEPGPCFLSATLHNRATINSNLSHINRARTLKRTKKN